MENRKPKDIKRSRRILILGSRDSGVMEVLKKFTGSAPEPVDGSAAGLSHIWENKNKYYNAEVPIWIDEISDPKAWSAEFQKAEAQEVVVTIGAFIYCFRKPKTEDDLEHIRNGLEAVEAVIDRWFGLSFEGSKLAVAMPHGTTLNLKKTEQEWEEFCQEYFFEYIDSEDPLGEILPADTRNNSSPPPIEPVGYARLKEVLECTDWDADNYPEEYERDYEYSEGLLQFDREDAGLDKEMADMDTEFKNLKDALLSGSTAKDENDEYGDGDSPEQLEEFERMMTEIMAIKDTRAAMPEDERRNFSEKALRDMMQKFEL